MTFTGRIENYPVRTPGNIPFGCELMDDERIGLFEKIYMRLFGAPILGLRLRARALLPLIRSVFLKPGSRILDAGCGRGLFSFYLARCFPDCHVIGMDTDDKQIEINNKIKNKRNFKNCDFICSDITQLKNDELFSFILSVDNLEHIKDDLKQCRLFFSVLQPGGKLLIHVPHLTRNLFGFKSQNFMRIQGHVRSGYTMVELNRMLRDAGFYIEKSFYDYGYFETLANNISYLITGGKEKKRHLYALAFPWLLLLSQLGQLEKPKQGSGLVMLAGK